MKPQLQPRSIPVLRHVHDFCVAWGLSQVIALTAEAVPSVLLTQKPDPISNPTTPSHYNTYLPSSSSQPSANQIP
jgi:hypothetical protein